MAKPRKSCATSSSRSSSSASSSRSRAPSPIASSRSELMRWALVPRTEYREVPLPQGANYGAGGALDRAAGHRQQSRFVAARGRAAGQCAAPRLGLLRPPDQLPESNAWNAPLDHGESRNRAALFVRSQASAFNGLGAVWAPNYRQATFGAFLTNKDDARRALDLAYRDVLAAYEQFLRAGAGRPADHPRRPQPGQPASDAAAAGADTQCPRSGPDRRRSISIGWPVSLNADLPALSLPACETATQARCVALLAELAEPADPSQMTEVYDETNGPGGARRGDGRCSASIRSPAPATAAPARIAMRGTLIPNEQMTEATLRAGAVAARCGRARFPADRRAGYAARNGPLRAAGEQLPRLRLRPVLGEHPGRRRAPAGDIHGGRAVITAAIPDFREALSEGGRLLGLDVGTKTIGTALCDAGWTIATPAELDPARQIREGPRGAAGAGEGAGRGGARHRPAAQSRRQRTARAPSRSAPSPATWKSRSVCRSCSGTSAGRPRR